jgi:hypothetical protein
MSPQQEVQLGPQGTMDGTPQPIVVGFSVRSAEPPGADQAMHMRMIGQGARPGEQHTAHPDQPADIVRFRSELHERLGRGTALTCWAASVC